MKYIFGPVNSRRFGFSLGIDLVTHKTCSLNCVYCECGRTTNLTSRLEEYVPVAEVIKEIDEYLSSNSRIDIITFSGSGEPTLHSGIGKIIDYLKDNYSYKVAVLTNGTLLNNKIVRTSLLRADLIVPSLDAVSDEVFQKMLRPAEGITSKNLIQGLIDFRNEYSGEIILEIFILPGMNDSPEELELIKNACIDIRADRIELNKLDRPGAEEWVKKIESKSLLEIKDFFKPLNVHIVGDPLSETRLDSSNVSTRDKIFSVLRRRPSTVEDLFNTTGVKRVELLKLLDEMTRSGEVTRVEQDRGIFYRINNSEI